MGNNPQRNVIKSIRGGGGKNRGTMIPKSSYAPDDVIEEEEEAKK